MSQSSSKSRPKRAGPTRQEQQRLRAAKDSRRSLALVQGKLDAIDAALAAARSSLRWLEQATQTVQSGEAHFRDHPLNLASHVAGAAEKSAALQATIERLLAERGVAAAALLEAEAQVVNARIKQQTQPQAAQTEIGVLSDAE